MSLRFAPWWLLVGIGTIACQPVAAHGGPIDGAKLQDGVFHGSASHIDKASVSITVERGRVVHVTVDVFDASPVGKPARDEIPPRIVERQSTKVDVVSGATEASNVIMNAVEDAVRKSYASRPGAP